MNSFAVLLLCIQACLVQNVLSQCSCGGSGLPSITPTATSSGYGCGGASVASFGYGLGGPGLIGNDGGLAHGTSLAAAYGGVGEGNVAVSGELPVSGNTAVIGHVPILGAVNFGGNVPASGSVCINGRCACGCGN